MEPKIRQPRLRTPIAPCLDRKLRKLVRPSPRGGEDVPGKPGLPSHLAEDLSGLTREVEHPGGAVLGVHDFDPRNSWPVLPCSGVVDRGRELGAAPFEAHQLSLAGSARVGTDDEGIKARIVRAPTRRFE